MKEINSYEVYKIIDLTNNKIYIGATTEGSGLRFHRHVIRAEAGSSYPIHQAILQHGVENFKVEILEFCNSLDHMNEREAYWIAFTGCTNPEIGYNGKAGGGIRFQTEESRSKIGEAHKGKISTKRKTVLQYSSEGNFIREYSSLSLAENMTGISRSSILRVINKKALRPSLKNPYIWIYKVEEVKVKINPEDYYQNLNYKRDLNLEFTQKRILTDGDMMKLATPVAQYDLDNNLIAKYESIAEASKKSGVSTTSIRKQVNDPEYINNLKQLSKTKFIWKPCDKNDRDIKELVSSIKTKATKRKTIEQYDLNGNLINTFNGIVEFMKEFHTEIRTIKNYINMGIPFKGFYWKIK